MTTRQLLLWVGVLSAAGLGIFLYKLLVLGLPLSANSETEVWNIQARVSFLASGGPVKARLEIPTGMPGFGILDEHFVSRGYGLRTELEGDRRQAQWAIRSANGQQNLYYRAAIYPDPARSELAAEPPPPPVPELEEPFLTALTALVTEVRSQSADVSTFTSEMLARTLDPSPSEDVDLLLGRAQTPGERAQVLVELLAGARIPARVANGLRLEERQARADFLPWLEVYNGEEWLFFDPASGEQQRPADLLLWWRGGSEMLEISGGRRANTQVSVQRDTIGTMEVAERRAELLGSRMVEFSLLGLPLQTQTVYGVVLLIPIGALLLVLLRNVVGIKTFGTFTPVLVALAFRETRLLWGIVLFCLVVTLGLAIRFYLERLRLLLVPRLAAVLTVVVLVMATVSVLSNRLGMERGLSVALFPLVILTMAIERMSVVWEERGAREAIEEGLGSLLVAALAYLAMSFSFLEHLLFVFPELLLLVLAAILLLGRYRGYRLLELRRFRALARESA